MMKPLTGRWVFVFCLGLGILLAGGCAGRGAGGPAEVRLTLDGPGEVSAQLPVNGVLVLEMPNPASGGYQFTGASFNPACLRLDRRYIEAPQAPKPGDFGRVFFVFSGLAEGESLVEIRIKRPFEKDSAPEVFRSVRVSVGAGD